MADGVQHPGPCGGRPVTGFGGAYTPDLCRPCWLYWNDAAYHRLWGGAAPPAPGRFRKDRPACRHLGEPTGQERPCISCVNQTAPVRRCALHGACVERKPVKDTRTCLWCPDREDPPGDGTLPYGGPPVRNLLFHVWPVRGNGVWQWHVEHLLRRMDLFNGRRVVAVVTDEYTDSAAAVKAAFGDAVRDYLELPNSPAYREVLTFLPLLQRVETLDPREVTFYCQGKGVRGQANPGAADPTPVRRWVEVMYASCLDYWPLAEQALLRHPLAGTFARDGAAFPTNVPWHFGGSFYWLRNALVFGRAWRQALERTWWGVESWPGRLCAAPEAACLFLRGPVAGDSPLYTADYWRDVAGPEWERWQAANAAHRRTP